MLVETKTLGRGRYARPVSPTALLVPLLFGIQWMDPNWLLDQFGTAFFWVSLAIIFVECGLFFPFLPGDTLLVAMGLFIAGEKISIVPGGPLVNLAFALVVLTAAAFAGNVVGYEIGRKIGPPLYEHDGRILKREYFKKTEAFFEKHGRKALVIGRFVPFVRTYITVVAGATRMDRGKFMVWSLVGAVDLGGQHRGDRLLRRRERAVAGREHRLRDPRPARPLGDPARLRVVAAPRATTTRPSRRRARRPPPSRSQAAYGVQVGLGQHRAAPRGRRRPAGSPPRATGRSRTPPARPPPPPRAAPGSRRAPRHRW